MCRGAGPGARARIPGLEIACLPGATLGLLFGAERGGGWGGQMRAGVAFTVRVPRPRILPLAPDAVLFRVRFSSPLLFALAARTRNGRWIAG